jgi:hypothetical protein
LCHYDKTPDRNHIRGEKTSESLAPLILGLWWGRATWQLEEKGVQLMVDRKLKERKRPGAGISFKA